MEMKVYLAALIVAGALLACTSGKPIYNVSGHPVPVQAQALSLQRIEALIIEAGQSRGWRFERVSAGKLRASQVQPKHTAVVDVTFDTRAYNITHVSTTGMEEKDGTVHSHYNFWIRNLEHDIETRLANAGATRGS
jgi:hypothetical protein